MDPKEAKFEIIFEGRFTSEEGVYLEYSTDEKVNLNQKEANFYE